MYLSRHSPRPRRGVSRWAGRLGPGLTRPGAQARRRPPGTAQRHGLHGARDRPDGRGPHKKLLERDTPEDHLVVASALRRVGIEPLGERSFDTLSGGEKQRVLIARALAQAPRLLVLDEPTTHLDIGHQLQVLRLIRALGVTTIAALHDLNLAAAYCDQMVVLKRGSIEAHGHPVERTDSRADRGCLRRDGHRRTPSVDWQAARVR